MSANLRRATTRISVYAYKSIESPQSHRVHTVFLLSDSPRTVAYTHCVFTILLHHSSFPNYFLIMKKEGRHFSSFFFPLLSTAIPKKRNDKKSFATGAFGSQGFLASQASLPERWHRGARLSGRADPYAQSPLPLAVHDARPHLLRAAH